MERKKKQLSLQKEQSLFYSLLLAMNHIGLIQLIPLMNNSNLPGHGKMQKIFQNELGWR